MKDPAEVLKDLYKEVKTIKPERQVFVVDVSKLRDAMARLKSFYGDEGVYISTIVGVDKADEGIIELNYFVHIIPLRKTIGIQVRVPRDEPKVPSIIDTFPGALAGECETYDLLGVVFEGNNYIRRGFFVPSDIVEKGVFPLRKDAKV